MNSISPITKTDNVSFIKSIKTDRIIALYKKLGYDVERFFVGLDKIDIYQCNESKLKYFHPTNIAGDADFYEALGKNTKNYYSDWKWEHEQVIKHVEKNASVLEVGCAHGSFLKKTLERGAGRASGLELNLHAVEEAKKSGLDVSSEMIEEHAKKMKAQYDLVCSFQVVEHISDLDSYISSSLECLKQGGKFVISVPNFDCYLYQNDLDHTLNLPPHHMGLWTEEALRNIAKIYNLEVVEIKKQPAIKENYGLYYEVFLRNTLKLEGGLKSLVLSTTRPLVKILMNIYPPKLGVCITAIYRKK